MSRPPDRPRRVVVLGTGGTIAGRSAGAGGIGYRAGVLPVQEVLAAVAPSLRARLPDVEVSAHSLVNVDSVDLGTQQQLEIAHRVRAVLDEPDLAGVVVTHGTDTIAETAYLLHLLIRSERPVVLVGAMRPADHPSPDGPGNLADAVAVAVHPHSAGLGTLVVLDGEIHAAREVVKGHTVRVGGFRSRHGPLGEVVDGVPRYSLRPHRRLGRTDFELRDLTRLPRVDLLLSYADLPVAVVETLVATGSAGIVHVGPGNGSVPAAVAAALAAARARGVAVVRSGAPGDGPVTRNGSADDDAHGWVAGGDLSPGAARLLLSLALTRTSDPAQLQAIFDSH